MNVGITDLKLHDLPVLSYNDSHNQKSNEVCTNTDKITTHNSLLESHDELNKSYRLYLQQKRRDSDICYLKNIAQCVQTDKPANDKSNSINATCTNIQNSISAESDENASTTCAEHSLKVFAGIIGWGINKYLR